MTEPELVRLHLRQVPVELWHRTQEHSDELQREFMLIATDSRDPSPGHDVPQRLLMLIDVLTKRYSGFGDENERLMAKAAAEGTPAVDLVYDLPVGVGADLQQLGELLDEADEFCRRGQHLLTLATPADQVQFRKWFIDELVRQSGGAAPRPWPADADA